MSSPHTSASESDDQSGEFLLDHATATVDERVDTHNRAGVEHGMHEGVNLWNSPVDSPASEGEYEDIEAVGRFEGSEKDAESELIPLSDGGSMGGVPPVWSDVDPEHSPVLVEQEAISDAAVVVVRPAGLPTMAPAAVRGLPVAMTPMVRSLPTRAPAPLVAPIVALPIVAAATPLPTVAPSGSYRAVGELSAEQLLYGKPGQFLHLDETIVKVRDWLQEYLSSIGKSAEVAEARADPSKRAEMASMIDRYLIQYLSKESVTTRGKDRNIVVAAVTNEILGLGPIEPLWSDERITEVMVNGPNNVYVEMSGKITPAPGARFRDREHLLEVCTQILMPLNRRVDQKSPLADGRLPDGSRVNIVHYSVAPNGPLLTIRRFPATVWTMNDFVLNKSVTEEMACELAFLIYHKCSAIIVGSTGAGKALDVSTPIPTPDGFISMGNLEVGSTVIDQSGEPCSVTGVFDQEPNRPCFEVVFSDGSVLVADGDHLWETRTEQSRSAGLRNYNTAMDYYAAVGTLTGALNTGRTGDTMTVEAVVELIGGRYLSVVEEASRRVTALVSAGQAPLGNNKYDWSALLSETRNVLMMQNSEMVAAAVRTETTVLTTTEIASTLRTSDGKSNYSIDVAGVASFPERTLALDPYVLGAWLGHGKPHSANMNHTDRGVINAFGAQGFASRRCLSLNRSHVIDNLEPLLSQIGVWGRKHIPSEYLFSSEEQRRAMLAGLMDTDGVAITANCAVFTHDKKDLVDDVYALVCSLGFRATMTEESVRGRSRGSNHVWRVKFDTDGTIVFSLPRKIAAANGFGPCTPSENYRYITDVRPVLSRPVRCITVDSPRSLYLAGTSFIPTHNTSLLNALSSCIPRDERVVTVEDSLELRLHPDAHVASLEARPPSASGEGEVTIRNLVKNALRMRPDRIVVGEVRDGAALDMLQAMNTGHEGSLTTVHANGAEEAINRLAVLVAQGGDIPESKVSWMIGDSVDLIVIQNRYEDGSRRVSGIYEIPSMQHSTTGTLKPIPLWEWEQTSTDERGMFVGGYVQRNQISAQLRAKRRLDQFEEFTMDDIRRMSELTPQNAKG